MAYNIKRTNGDLYAVIGENLILGPNSPEGVPAPINLIGRNKVSYGQAQNENFLWLTENFASNTVPNSAIRGQLWYNTRSEVSANTGGELLLCPYDGASDRSKWLTVPVISRVSNEPTEANEGRMIIYKNDSLRVRLDGEWKVINTGLEQDNIFRSLLPIRYSDDNKIVSLPNPDYDANSNTTVPEKVNVKVLPHEPDVWKDVAVFNQGGSTAANTDIVINGEGALKYGGSYKWESTIIARQADNIDNFKSWKMSGAFTVPSVSYQLSKIADLPIDNTKYINPDPRILKESYDTGVFYANSCVKEILTYKGATSEWDVTVVPRLDWPNAVTNLGTKTSPEDSLNGDYFGLMFQGLVSGAAEIRDIQWTINFELVGIPQITPGTAANIYP